MPGEGTERRDLPVPKPGSERGGWSSSTLLEVVLLGGGRGDSPPESAPVEAHVMLEEEAGLHVLAVLTLLAYFRHCEVETLALVSLALSLGLGLDVLLVAASIGKGGYGLEAGPRTEGRIAVSEDIIVIVPIRPGELEMLGSGLNLDVPLGAADAIDSAYGLRVCPWMSLSVQ